MLLLILQLQKNKGVLKMKRKVFKPWVQNTLELITMLLIMCIAMIDDFEMSAVPVLCVIMAVLMINTALLNTYGRN